MHKKIFGNGCQCICKIDFTEFIKYGANIVLFSGYLQLTHYNPVLLFCTPWKHQKTWRHIFKLPATNVVKIKRSIVFNISKFKTFRLNTIFTYWASHFKTLANMANILALWAEIGRKYNWKLYLTTFLWMEFHFPKIF